MATNLRLSNRAAEAVRNEAKRSGRSQQDVIRAAVDQYLEPKPTVGIPADVRDQIIPPQRPFIHDIERVKLPPGMTSLDLLDRDDRI